MATRKREKFIAELRVCGSVKHAATLAGLRAHHLYVERKTNEALAEAWDAALDEFAGRMHRELQDAALGDGRWVKPDVRALIALNKAHTPELFDRQRDTIVNVTVGSDYDSHIPLPARPPVIEAQGHTINPPPALPKPQD